MRAADTTLIARRNNAALQATAEVTVIISCFNYGVEAQDAVKGIAEQTERAVSVVIIDDHSTNDSVDVIAGHIATMELGAIADISLYRHKENLGLSQTRNTALHFVTTPYVFVLDADNIIYPRALARLKEAIEASGRPAAYSAIQIFGEEHGVMGNSVWIDEKFAFGNYIDAMAMFRTSILIELGGYREMPHRFGWEDYDLWCSFVDRQLKACHVPEILCGYRVHRKSMLNTTTRKYVRQRLDDVRKHFNAHHCLKFRF